MGSVPNATRCLPGALGEGATGGGSAGDGDMGGGLHLYETVELLHLPSLSEQGANAGACEPRRRGGVEEEQRRSRGGGEEEERRRRGEKTVVLCAVLHVHLVHSHGA